MIRFYELCYDQYKQEMKDADILYQRAGVMLLVLPLLSTTMLALGRIDLFKLIFVRIDVFLYYLAFLVAIITIIVGVVFLFLCVYPRTYETLADMKTWQKYRDDYKAYLNKNGDTKSEGADALELATIESLCSQLVDAQPVNAKINEKRRKAFQKSILMAAIALVVIGLQALFYLILKVQGV